MGLFGLISCIPCQRIVPCVPHPVFLWARLLIRGQSNLLFTFIKIRTLSKSNSLKVIFLK